MEDNVLYLTDDSANFLAGCPAPFVEKRVPSIKDEIVVKINQQVETVVNNDRKSLPPKKLTSYSAMMLCEYQDYDAKQEALHRFINGNPPDGLLHSDFNMDKLQEAAFMAYLQDPEVFIQTEAKQYIQSHQEDLLLRFLKNDALLAEYQTLEQDAASSIHRMRAITAAVNGCGGKAVTVTVQKDGKELTFKTGVNGLQGYHSYYSPSLIAVPDRREFERLFGKGADYTPEDIVRITYGRNTIYEALPFQSEAMEQDTGPAMDGMRM